MESSKNSSPSYDSAIEMTPNPSPSPPDIMSPLFLIHKKSRNRRTSHDSCGETFISDNENESSKNNKTSFLPVYDCSVKVSHLNYYSRPPVMFVPLRRSDVIEECQPTSFDSSATSDTKENNKNRIFSLQFLNAETQTEGYESPLMKNFMDSGFSPSIQNRKTDSQEDHVKSVRKAELERHEPYNHLSCNRSFDQMEHSPINLNAWRDTGVRVSQSAQTCSSDEFPVFSHSSNNSSRDRIVQCARVTETPNFESAVPIEQFDNEKQTTLNDFTNHSDESVSKPIYGSYSAPCLKYSVGSPIHIVDSTPLEAKPQNEINCHVGSISKSTRKTKASTRNLPPQNNLVRSSHLTHMTMKDLLAGNQLYSSEETSDDTIMSTPSLGSCNKNNYFDRNAVISPLANEQHQSKSDQSESETFCIAKDDNAFSCTDEVNDSSRIETSESSTLFNNNSFDLVNSSSGDTLTNEKCYLNTRTKCAFPLKISSSLISVQAGNESSKSIELPAKPTLDTIYDESNNFEDHADSHDFSGDSFKNFNDHLENRQTAHSLNSCSSHTLNNVSDQTLDDYSSDQSMFKFSFDSFSSSHSLSRSKSSKTKASPTFSNNDLVRDESVSSSGIHFLTTKGHSSPFPQYSANKLPESMKSPSPFSVSKFQNIPSPSFGLSSIEGKSSPLSHSISRTSCKSPPFTGLSASRNSLISRKNRSIFSSNANQGSESPKSRASPYPSSLFSSSALSRATLSPSPCISLPPSIPERFTPPPPYQTSPTPYQTNPSPYQNIPSPYSSRCYPSTPSVVRRCYQPTKLDEDGQEIKKSCAVTSVMQHLFRDMLLLWCRQNLAVRSIGQRDPESDKTVLVSRASGEFGFRIHGSRPVVVSAIESDTPAETSGLEVGDIVLAINGVSVLEASHSEVVKLAHSGGGDTLRLEVARTCNLIAPLVTTDPTPVCAGYLYKLGAAHRAPGSSAITRRWHRRWFALTKDHCLYHYKAEGDQHPLGAVVLRGHTVHAFSTASRPYAFTVSLPGEVGLQLAAHTSEARGRWGHVITQAAEQSAQRDELLEASSRRVQQAPGTIAAPDCFGFLYKIGARWHQWKKRYCVLKDACLYIYHDTDATMAIGVIHLHGYRVQSTSIGGKKHAFELLPPEPKFRHFYFHSDSDYDKKRWLAALEYSIDRWIKVG